MASQEKASNGLNEQQQLFVDYYLADIGMNATSAAIKAGYSEKTARQQASRLLSNVNIQMAIKEAQNARNERVEVDQDYVLNRLIQVDQLDIIDILDNTGNFKPINEWSKEWRLNLSSFEIVETAEGGFVKKIKFPDKVKNLELLGSHIKVGAWMNKQTIDLNASVKAEVSSLSDLMDELADESQS